MSEADPLPPWSEEQWASLQQLVQESARRARVASSFLPLHGPLEPGQVTVPALPMELQDIAGRRPQRGEADNRLEIDDGKTLRVTTIACDLYLKTQEVRDPELAAARDLLGRAADIVGRLEDTIVFNGQPDEHEAPGNNLPKIYTVHGGQRISGLLNNPDSLRQGIQCEADLGERLVGAIVAAIQQLEGRGHYGPFACVLGHTFFRAANTPNPGALVLPSDRIVPFLNGPLLRSSVVPDSQGVVVALAGRPIDLVVATDIHVNFVQMSVEPRYVLRVSERFVLRMKQPTAACVLFCR
jgi:uncharacterized linocin/CFP29 family protein